MKKMNSSCKEKKRKEKNTPGRRNNKFNYWEAGKEIDALRKHNRSK
jgi:hypothetical protein